MNNISPQARLAVFGATLAISYGVLWINYVVSKPFFESLQENGISIRLTDTLMLSAVEHWWGFGACALLALAVAFFADKLPRR